MVDTNGKPYESSRVNNVADRSANNTRQLEVGYEDVHIRSVTNLSLYHHLNW
jgi:hypothetical protein